MEEGTRRPRRDNCLVMRSSLREIENETKQRGFGGDGGDRSSGGSRVFDRRVRRTEWLLFLRHEGALEEVVFAVVVVDHQLLLAAIRRQRVERMERKLAEGVGHRLLIMNKQFENRTTKMRVSLLLSHTTKSTPLKGPERTDTTTLVFRELIHVSGSIPRTLISDSLLIISKIDT